MAIQIIGNSGVVGDVESNTRALKVTLRPQDYGTLGIYRLGMVSGTMAAGLAANAEIFQFRWTDATRICTVKEVQLSVGAGATGFTAGVCTFDMLKASPWSSDGSGGTAANLTAANAKLRTSMGSTLLGAARIASTAALTGGTKTLDNQGIGALAGSFSATAGVGGIPPSYLFNCETEAEHPLVLTQNEGFVIRATVPATGTWSFAVGVKWAEYVAY